MSLLDENITECLDDILIPYEDIKQYLKKYTWYDELKLDSLHEIRWDVAKSIYIKYFEAVDLDNKQYQYKVNGLVAKKFKLIDEGGICHIRFPFHDHDFGTRILYLITNDQYFEIPKWLNRMSKVDNFAVAILYGTKIKAF